MKRSLLDGVRVVLHQTQDLVNVAAVVRAMKNMGVSDLWLVDAVPLDRWRVAGIAHGTEDILDRVRQCESLVESLHECVLVAAFTARRRAAKWRVVTPREAAAELLARVREGPVALLFGREDRGLPNEALDLANLHVTIPTTEYASLNLAQAVMVALYELHVAAGDATRVIAPPRKAAPPPDFEAVQQFYRDLELALECVDFFKTRNREHIMRSLRAITSRASPDARELSLLRAIAIEIRKKLERQATHGSAAPSLDLPSSD
ncbi:MAG TPA: TrmJ/YjtD family RNA methyltransferase [Gemmatimonadaceae bacterium]|nr:TrmJ/YjtD family RNA methyltransferase [Gemmatimonadaceae bacterium]